MDVDEFHVGLTYGTWRKVSSGENLKPSSFGIELRVFEFKRRQLPFADLRVMDLPIVAVSAIVKTDDFDLLHQGNRIVAIGLIRKLVFPYRSDLIRMSLNENRFASLGCSNLKSSPIVRERIGTQVIVEEGDCNQKFHLVVFFKIYITNLSEDWLVPLVPIPFIFNSALISLSVDVLDTIPERILSQCKPPRVNAIGVTRTQLASENRGRSSLQ